MKKNTFSMSAASCLRLCMSSDSSRRWLNSSVFKQNMQSNINLAEERYEKDLPYNVRRREKTATKNENKNQIYNHLIYNPRCVLFVKDFWKYFRRLKNRFSTLPNIALRVLKRWFSKSVPVIYLTVHWERSQPFPVDKVNSNAT